jgi:hypothetical protein
MQPETPIATITKNSTENLCVRLNEYRGSFFVDLRVFVGGKGDNTEPVPTKKGVSLRIDKLNELMAALADARAEAERRGLLKGAGA